MHVTDANDAAATAEAVARRSYGRLVAFLAARTGDVAGAEDALSDAFAAALAEWPRQGPPANPEAWLLTVARRKGIDAGRRRRTVWDAAGHVQLLTEELASEGSDATAIPDDRLALLFVCAHPAIDRAVRAPLMLQAVLGFDAASIASAFLMSPAAMRQRLVRAKQKIRQARIPFRVPDRAELTDRLGTVLEAVYAAFAEGWADPNGTEVRRRNLAAEAIWLARLLAALLPEEPEVLGLLALLLYSEARRRARRDAQGDYVPLTRQDVAAWNGAMIAEAESLLRRAGAVARPARFQIEAAVQSAHVARRLTGQIDWPAIVLLYDALAAITESPVVAINRAVALAETDGPATALAALDSRAGDGRLAEYQPYWAARADLLARAGQNSAAWAAFQQAIGLETDPAVRRFLLQQRDALEPVRCG